MGEIINTDGQIIAGTIAARACDVNAAPKAAVRRCNSPAATADLHGQWRH